VIAKQLTQEQIQSEKGFDLIVEAVKKHFASHMEAEPEVLAELAVDQTQREK